MLSSQTCRAKDDRKKRGDASEDLITVAEKKTANICEHPSFVL